MPAPTPPLRHDQREITEGVFGWLESPRPQDLGLDCVLVSGWTFSRASSVIAVYARISGHQESVQYGLRRDDVKAAYPSDLGASYSGFSAFCEFDQRSFRQARLEVWATLEDGRDVRLFHRLLKSPGAFANRTRRLLRDVVQRLARSLSAPGPAPPAHLPAPPGPRQMIESISRLALRTFLTSGARLRYEAPSSPFVSVVVVLWNRSELTLRCLRSLCEQSGAAFEVVLVDNHSTDATSALLGRVVGATIIRNGANLGFTVAANLGAQAASGEFLLFLNNDAELMLELFSVL